MSRCLSDKYKLALKSRRCPECKKSHMVTVNTAADRYHIHVSGDWHSIQPFFVSFFSLKISNASKTEESRLPPDKGNFKNATPFLSLPTATASDNMQSYDYWPCAANFTVTQPTLDSTLIPTTLSSRRGLLTVQKPCCLLYLSSLFRPVERPANRL